MISEIRKAELTKQFSEVTEESEFWQTIDHLIRAERIAEAKECAATCDRVEAEYEEKQTQFERSEGFSETPEQRAQWEFYGRIAQGAGNCAAAIRALKP